MKYISNKINVAQIRNIKKYRIYHEITKPKQQRLFAD